TREQFLKTCNFRVDYVAFKVLETQHDVICCKKLLQNEDARGQREGDRGCTSLKSYLKTSNIGVDCVVFKVPEIKYDTICWKKFCQNEGATGGYIKINI